ncbi:MAG TPA: TetR/AcrR family transcriptional regulator [Deltaproteobacteria bacterium]|nr:TetR/AcrR family transcriptional regulator [Deltaproteobacteria bacterium]
MKDIAKIAGVAEGTIYIYFKNKEDLLISIFKEKTRETIESIKTEVQKEKNPLDKLKRLIFLHLETYQKEKDLAKLYQLELRQSIRLTTEYFKVEHKDYLDLIGEIIKEGKDQGIFRADLNESIVKRVLFGAVDEVITTWVVSSKEYDLISVYDPLVDVLLNGLLNPDK